MHSFVPQHEGFLGVADGPETDGAGVVVLPVPFEQTSSYGHGSSQGPAQIIEASHQVEIFDTALGFEPYAAASIQTLPPLPLDDIAGAAVTEQVEQAVRHWLASGKRVVTLGGEHTTAVGAIKAHVDFFHEVTIVQLDAHSDLRASYEGDPWSHACTMARVLDFHANIAQVGIRSESREEREFADAQGLPVFRAEELHRRDKADEDWIGDIIRATAGQVYVTLDCDVFDPAIIPATGTPEPAGLTWQQVDALLARLCAERDVVGFDVCELAPIDGLHHPQFIIAKLIYRLIGYMHREHSGIESGALQSSKEV